MNKIEKEIWKDIVRYENYYQISNYGKVKSLERMSINCWRQKRLLREMILANNINTKGYCYVSLHKPKVNRKKFLVHRLVGIHFIDNPNNKPQINHIDYNKVNNYYKNLEWVTNKENGLHGSKPK